MNYAVEVFSSARKEILALPGAAQSRVADALLRLAENPRPNGAVKLKGGGGYRIRVGDYRILYLIADAVKIVSVYRVRHRKEVYD